MNLIFPIIAFCLTLGFSPAYSAGIDVGAPSLMRNLIPGEQLEQQAATEYNQLKQKAASQKLLVGAQNQKVQLLRRIANRIIPFTERWNNRSREWQWEVNLLRAPEINAFCMPGGKIAFYTGILNSLWLNNDEVAVIMGHEIAHALREHARENMAKSEVTNLGAQLLGAYIGGGKYTGLFSLGGNLLNLKFSRENENEADLIGLDLAARAGFDPRSGVTLWEKMAAASKGAPPQWLSTHPANSTRIAEIQKHLPEVIPLYEQARRTQQ